LVVVVVVDQLRPDRITRELPGGLGRLMREGYIYSSARLDYAASRTCPGHATMATGVNPNRTGIPSNNYVVRQTFESTYCVSDDDSANAVIGGKNNRSPNSIHVSGLGDWLKAASPESRAFAVAGKDRAAIPLAGKTADGAFWYMVDTVGFTSSRYYMSELPDYVREFNGREFFVDGFGGGTPESWDHPRNDVWMEDFPSESELKNNSGTHAITAEEGGNSRARNFHATPYLDSATAALAKRVLTEEELGKRGVTDYLAVGFSASDVVGHLYGPYSAESADTLIRLDLEVGALMTMLDEELGGDYVLALTSDHGVMPMPEYLKERDQFNCPEESGRVDLTGIGFWSFWNLHWQLSAPLSNPRNLVKFSNAGAMVNERYAVELGVGVDEVVDVLEQYFEKQPAVVEAWTVEETMSGEGAMARLYRNSYVDGRTGHVVLQLAQSCVGTTGSGTSHGSPYLYDRRVPLVFFGKGIAPGQSVEEVHSVDMAPTLGNLLELKMPDDLDGRVLGLPLVTESR